MEAQEDLIDVSLHPQGMLVSILYIKCRYQSDDFEDADGIGADLMMLMHIGADLDDADGKW